MGQNRDWKLIVALILGGLAIFIALRGERANNGYGDYGNNQASMGPQQIIVQPVVPMSGATGATTAPMTVAPGTHAGFAHMGGSQCGWGGGPSKFSFLPLLFLGGIIFLAFRMFGSRRQGWGGPGWNGGPGPGPQAPPAGPPSYQQHTPAYPAQYTQGHSQNSPAASHQGEQPQQGQQGEPTRAIDKDDDITQPEGSRDH